MKWAAMQPREDGSIDIVSIDPKTDQPQSLIASVRCVAWCNAEQTKEHAKLIVDLVNNHEGYRSISDEAYRHLLALLDLDSMLWSDLGPHLSCREAEVFCDFLIAHGQKEKARVLFDAHCCGDDGQEGDDPKHIERKELLEALPPHEYRQTPPLERELDEPPDWRTDKERRFGL